MSKYHKEGMHMKRTLPILLILAVIVSLCGCRVVAPGESSTPGTTAPSQTDTGSETEIATAPSETSTEPITETLPPDSLGLLYEVNSDGTSCTVTGIGTCQDSYIVIPSTCDGYLVTGIGNFAFSRCQTLTNICIPDGVTSVGNAAFSGCHSLISVHLPDSVTSIGHGAFSDCNLLTDLVIPDCVTSIERMAFAGCHSLFSICIPSSVASIDEFAFYYCIALTDIHFDGTRAQWNAITKQEAWDDSAADYTIHCTDGTLSK